MALYVQDKLDLALQQQGKLKEAIEEFPQAIALDTNYVADQDNLKEAQTSSENKEKLITQKPLSDCRTLVHGFVNAIALP